MKYDEYSRDRHVNDKTVNYSIKLSTNRNKYHNPSIRKYVNKKRYIERNQSRKNKYSEPTVEPDCDIILGLPDIKLERKESIINSRKRKREYDSESDYYNYRHHQDKEYINSEYNRLRVLIEAKYISSISKLKCSWYETHAYLEKYGNIGKLEYGIKWSDFM